ncbi:MAG: hypothetical protein GY820_12245 [Gammaproteobacteria bacterium]|nr:hypothetical protein [Gammaproteobacteria bacterium]
MQAWEQENSSAAPSYPQLEKLAYDIYKRPIALFFLPEPPSEAPPKAEFRTLPVSDLESLSPDTYLHIRKAHAYQLALEEIFENENPSVNRVWRDVTVPQNANIAKVAKEVRLYLGIDIELQSQWLSPDKALKYLREMIEEKWVRMG